MTEEERKRLERIEDKVDGMMEALHIRECVNCGGWHQGWPVCVVPETAPVSSETLTALMAEIREVSDD